MNSKQAALIVRSWLFFIATGRSQGLKLGSIQERGRAIAELCLRGAAPLALVALFAGCAAQVESSEPAESAAVLNIAPPPAPVAPVLPSCTPDPDCAAPDFDSSKCIDVPGESGGLDRRVCVMADGTEWDRPDVDKGLGTHYVPVPNTRHAPAYELCEVLLATGAIIWRAPPGYVGTGAGSNE